MSDEAEDQVEDVEEQAEETKEQVEDVEEQAEEVQQKAEDIEDDAETVRERATEAEERVDGLIEVADEAEDVLSTVDVIEVLRSLDPEGVDLDGLSEAFAEGKPLEAIDAGELIDLSEAFDAVDVREFWKEARELQEAADDLPDEVVPGGGDEGGGLVDAAADDVVEDVTDAETVAVPDEGIQTAVQKGLSEAVEEFRAGLLETREHLEAMREANEDRIEAIGQPSSRNPTAVSTMASAKGSEVNATRHSTVPSETRYSNAPNRRRIYGSRFEREGDDDE